MVIVAAPQAGRPAYNSHCEGMPRHAPATPVRASWAAVALQESSLRGARLHHKNKASTRRCRTVLVCSHRPQCHCLCTCAESVRRQELEDSSLLTLAHYSLSEPGQVMQRSCRERGKAAVNSGAVQLRGWPAGTPVRRLPGTTQTWAPARAPPLPPHSSPRAGRLPVEWAWRCKRAWLAAKLQTVVARRPSICSKPWHKWSVQGKHRGSAGESTRCKRISWLHRAQARVLFADCPAVLPLRHAGTRRTGASRTSRTGCHTSRAGSWPQACLPLCLQHCSAVAWLTSLGQ